MFFRSSSQDLESIFSRQPKRSSTTKTISRDQFIDEIPEDIVCKICSQVNMKPLRCIDCSSSFCKECIEKARGSPIFLFTQADIFCPSCYRKTIRDASRTFMRRLESLHIKCHLCCKLIQLVQFKDHNRECAFSLVACSNRACGKHGLRKDFFICAYIPSWIAAGKFKTEYFACSEQCKMQIEAGLI